MFYDVYFSGTLTCVKHEEGAVTALLPAGVAASTSPAVPRSLRQRHVSRSPSCGRPAFPEGRGSGRAALPGGTRAVGLPALTYEGLGALMGRAVH